MSHYKHLTIEEREQLNLLKGQGKSIREIGRELNRSASTISILHIHVIMSVDMGVIADISGIMGEDGVDRFRLSVGSLYACFIGEKSAYRFTQNLGWSRIFKIYAAINNHNHRLSRWIELAL